MDVETSEAIEQLGQRVDLLEGSLRGELGSLRGDIRAGLAEMELRLERRFEENRRHTEVLFESLRDDIRILAEGFATLSAKLDSGR